METLNPRAGFLSSYEVYTVLRRQREQREQDVKQLLREKSAVMKPYNRAVAEQKQQIEDEEKAEAERKATEEKEGKSGKRKQHQQQAADKKEKPKPIPMPARRFDEELERIQPSDLNTVTFECLKYLELEHHPVRKQTREHILDLMEALKPWPLTKGEKLMILNIMPSSMVVLYVIVEDIEERFEEEQRDELMELIQSHVSRESLIEPVIVPRRVVKSNGVVKEESPTPQMPAYEANDDDDEMDVEQMDVDYDEAVAAAEEDEELIGEGIRHSGGREAEARDIDEVDS